MISQDTINEVKSKIDIVDVISDFVTLKRVGENYRALSPFNSEKTPSFFVVPKKGIFKDFSSGKGGDAITFIIEHEGLTYVEALKFLAKRYGVEIVEDSKSENASDQREKEGLHILLNFAKEHFQSRLLEHEKGKAIALSYFQDRQINDRTIKKFELGYALDGWSDLLDSAKKENFSEDLLEKAGLIVKNESGRVYDRFRDRVIFPIHNLSGKVIAFAARLIGNNNKKEPKYTNSPETTIYQKGQVLYGLYLAKNSIRQLDNCYLVEGYTDVISLHQSNIENVVASAGTSLTGPQIKLIKRFTDNITVLFDGDSAGIKAAMRGIDLILEGDLNVKVVLLPDGHDPDSFLHKVGTSQFQNFLETHTQDFISFKSEIYVKDSEGDPIRKAESVKEILNSIALIPNTIKHSIYVQKTSELLNISESILIAELNKILINKRLRIKRENAETQDYGSKASFISEQMADLAESELEGEDIIFNQEKETLALLLNYANHDIESQKIIEFLNVELLDEVEFSNPIFKIILEEIKKMASTGREIDITQLLESENKEVRNVVAELCTDRHVISTGWQEKYHIFVPEKEDMVEKRALSHVWRFKLRLIQKMIDETIAKLSKVDKWEDIDEHFDYLMVLKKAEQELSDKLGIIVSR